MGICHQTVAAIRLRSPENSRPCCPHCQVVSSILLWLKAFIPFNSDVTTWPPSPLPSPVSAKRRAGLLRGPESRGQGWGKPCTAVSAGRQDAWVLTEEWNVESGQELRIQRLKSCEEMGGEYWRGPPGWYKRGKQLWTAWGLGYKMLLW